MTQVAEPEATRWVGGGLKRKEDPKLITGQGRYVDDIALPGMLYLAFARSPFAFPLDEDLAEFAPRIERSRAFWQWQAAPSSWSPPSRPATNPTP